MSEKHTPGPWTAGRRAGARTCIDSERDNVAAAWSDADAKLIAAAPDLLEVARLFVDYAETTEFDRGPCKADVEAARAAIAKAEGRAS